MTVESFLISTPCWLFFFFLLPRFNLQLCPRYSRIFTSVFTQALSETFDPHQGHHWCRLSSNLWPCTGSQAVLIFSAIIWLEGTPKTQLWHYSTNSSASCSDWQVRAPVRLQLSMATHLEFFQRFETASQDAPLFLPQCRCYIELLPDRLLTLLDVGDLKHMNAFYSHVTLELVIHRLACTHTCSRAMCVSANSLRQRVFAVWMLHHSLSLHTAWPSKTALQWWLKKYRQILHALTVISSFLYMSLGKKGPNYCLKPILTGQATHGWN